MGANKIFPETPAPWAAPGDMNKHLEPVWYQTKKAIVGDQEAVKTHLARIRQIKQEIKFFKNRIVVNHKALQSLGEIKGE